MEMESLEFGFNIAGAAIFGYAIWFYLLARRLSGPRVLPLVGSLPFLFMNRRRIHDWIASNLGATGASSTYQTCTIALPFLARKQGFYTVTCHPKNIEHVLRTRFDNYPKGPRWQAAFHDLLGQGIFNSDGEAWLVQRKTAALEFTTRTLRQAMGRWVNMTIKNHPETLSPELPKNPFAVAFDTVTEATLKRLLYPALLWRLQRVLGIGPEKRIKSGLRIVENYMKEAIEARKQAPSDDLLSRFMRKKDVGGNNFTSAVLQRIALNFVLAGRDTSSVALSWFFWLVMNHQEIEQKIVDEISTVLRNTRGPDSKKWLQEPLMFDEADKLIYLKAALAETLRLYPSVPQDFKYVVQDDVLPDGTFVPNGSTVTYSIYSVGRMKTIWGDDCMEFRPERWLSPQGDKFDPPKDGYKFVSFNAGPRTCLGKDLAYLQMKSVASAVLLRYRLSPVPGHRVEQKINNQKKKKTYDIALKKVTRLSLSESLSFTLNKSDRISLSIADSSIINSKGASKLNFDFPISIRRTLDSTN
ncbi:hypothetical protein GQ457_10G008940 [Hibiscus cannabinus]